MTPHYNFLPPLVSFPAPPVLVFSSEDKGSWRWACQDLITGAHFTLPKLGLIHLSTPVPLLTETCFCLCCPPTYVVFSFSFWNERKTGIRSELSERKNMFLFLLPLLLRLFKFLLKGLSTYFTYCCTKTFPCSFLCIYFWPSGDSTYSSVNTSTNPKPRCKHVFI